MVKAPEKSSFTTVKQHFENYKSQERDVTFLEYLVDKTNAADMEVMASLEQGTPEWKEARIGRITASNAGSVRSLRSINRSSTLMNNIFGTSDVKCKYTDHGILNEPFARNMYRIEESSKHKDLVVSEHGLFVNKKYPYLGASPDGIVECSCCADNRVLEIKCPFNAQDEYAVDIPLKYPDYHLELDENSQLRVKKSTAWYSQAIFQMGVLGLKQCDFVVHTKKDTAIIPISFDSKLWDLLQKKAERIFLEGVIHHL